MALFSIGVIEFPRFNETKNKRIANAFSNQADFSRLDKCKVKQSFGFKSPFRKKLCFPFYPPNNPDADLVQQIQRDGDQDQRHQIRWGDDGGHHHDDDQGMLSVAFQEVGFHDADLA